MRKCLHASMGVLGLVMSACGGPASNGSDSLGVSTAALENATANYSIAAVDVPLGHGTQAAGINAAGDVVGFFSDAANAKHGFLLSQGAYSQIDVPGAAWTEARGIGPAGEIVGSSNVNPANPPGTRHGYLLTQGAFQTELFPGHLGSIVVRITPSGDLIGCYHDNDLNVSMDGMVLGADGTNMSFMMTPSMYDAATPNGKTLVGITMDMTTKLLHGFVQDDSGVTPFDLPGAIQTVPWDITPSGDIVGMYLDSAKHAHGFLSNHDHVSTFDVPGAKATQIFGVNPGGTLVGTFTDSAGAVHGFIATPLTQ